MDWFYAIDGEHRGPVSQQDLSNLAQQGVITRQTLIWRNGMAEWQEYSALAPVPQPAPMPASPALGSTVAYTAHKEGQCATCGQPLAATDTVSISGRGYCAACKLTMVQRAREGAGAANESERTRNRFIKHEAAVKSIGTLYYFAGGASLLGAILGLKEGVPEGGWAGAVFVFVMAAVLLTTAPGLRRLKKGARIPVGIISGIGLLGIPFGTIFNAYILYLVFGQKGQMVFSREYKRVIEETPHIKYRTSPFLLVLIALVSLLFLFAIVVSFMGPKLPE